MAQKAAPWYAGDHQDALFYLLIAIFFVELITGGVAFFYGIIHAAPEIPGGPPIARFPWLAWAISAVVAPVALILVVHLAGTWVSRAMTREETRDDSITAPDSDRVPESMKRFYATVRHAPTVVVLVAILLIGAGLFFVDGAMEGIGLFFTALLPHLPWLAASVAGLLAFCFLAHAIMVYRQRKMENEYAWRREVLEKTGMVLMDKNTMAIPAESTRKPAIESAQVLDVEGKQLPPGEKND